MHAFHKARRWHVEGAEIVFDSPSERTLVWTKGSSHGRAEAAIRAIRVPARFFFEESARKNAEIENVALLFLKADELPTRTTSIRAAAILSTVYGKRLREEISTASKEVELSLDFDTFFLTSKEHNYNKDCNERDTKVW